MMEWMAMDGLCTTLDLAARISFATHNSVLTWRLILKAETRDGWAVRVSGRLREEAHANVKTTTIFHVAMEKQIEEDGRRLICSNEERANPGEGYCWRGKVTGKCLTSGLDEITHGPRAEPPHPGGLYLEALAWVGATAHAFQQVAILTGNQAEVDKYVNLDALQWSPSNKTHCDSIVDAKTREYMHVCCEGYLSLPSLARLVALDASEGARHVGSHCC
ncbi:hypothetical protein V8F33_010571 [Rhypophila sp. PSN 637]